jgi:limonene-1,2-epoxide hydrolase
MGAPQETAVRKFWAEAEVPGDHWDAAQVDRLVEYMSPDIHYQVYAWEHPVVGKNAVREELIRQAPLFHDFRSEILAIASQGGTDFMKRRDSTMLGRKTLTQHAVGVFEVDAEGKIGLARLLRQQRDRNEARRGREQG